MDENKAASSKEGEENIGKEKKAKEYVGVISDVITRRKRFIKAESQCFDYSYSVIIEVLIEKDDEFIKDIITFERRDHTKGINEFRDFIIGSGAFQYNEIGKLEPDLEKLLGRTCIVELVEDKVKNTQIVDEDEVPIKRLDIDINGRKVYMINEINSKLHIKIEDIYISNSMLNKIIISLCSNITTQGDSAGFSDHITNVNKKKKRFLKSIGLSNDSICITLNGKKCYQLDTAAILIAYFLFPPRTKDSFPMKVMNGEFKDITGNQLLAFLDKASDVSRILILSAKYCYSNLDLSDDDYIVNVEKKLESYLLCTKK